MEIKKNINQSIEGRGHNSTAYRLKSFVSRIEKMEQEKNDIGQDIKEIYLEAKSVGFDVKTIKTIIKRRKKGQDALEQEQALIETYEAAINGTQIDLFETEKDDAA